MSKALSMWLKYHWFEDYLCHISIWRKIMQYSWICLVFIQLHDQKEQWTWPNPWNLDWDHEWGPWNSWADFWYFREFKSRLIHSMALLIVMSVFLLARSLSHVAIVWYGRSRNKIKVCEASALAGFPSLGYHRLTILSNYIPSKETDLVPDLWRFWLAV